MGAGNETPEVAVRARALSVGYDGQAVQAGLDFEVAAGSIFGILGGSGCGKTTVLMSLVGLLEPLSGSIEVLGQPRRPLGSEAPRFGVAFQGGALFGSMSLIDNVALPLRRWTGLEPEAVEAVAASRLRLQRRLPMQLKTQRRPSFLLAGNTAMQHRVASCGWWTGTHGGIY